MILCDDCSQWYHDSCTDIDGDVDLWEKTCTCSSQMKIDITVYKLLLLNLTFFEFIFNNQKV